VNDHLSHITYPILFLAVLGRQLCLPLPAFLFLFSAGALAGSGQLSPAMILAFAVLGCLIADPAWFEGVGAVADEFFVFCALSRQIQAALFATQARLLPSGASQCS
jgi:membrane protein DedA with SNARE-associated domain